MLFEWNERRRVSGRIGTHIANQERSAGRRPVATALAEAAEDGAEDAAYEKTSRQQRHELSAATESIVSQSSRWSPLEGRVAVTLRW